MAYSTFSQNKNDQLLEPMFFGQSVNVARFDQQKHEIFEKLIEKQIERMPLPEHLGEAPVEVPYDPSAPRPDKKPSTVKPKRKFWNKKPKAQ